MSFDTYTSLNEILEKVHRDLPMDEPLPLSHAAEWAGEVLDLIKAPRIYVDLSKCISIEDHRGSLPCDFHQIVSVRNNSNGRPMTVSTDNFFAEYYSESCPDVPGGAQNNSVFATGTYQGTEEFDTALDTQRPREAGADEGQHSVFEEYYIKGSFVFTSFKKGEVLMVYKAFPVDENDLPMVPDDESVKQAVKHHIMERIAWRMVWQNKLQMQLFKEIQVNRDHYVGQAETSLQMPTMDEMEAWKNSFLRSIPKPDQHSTGFRDQGTPEQRYTHNSYQGPGKRFNGRITV